MSMSRSGMLVYCLAKLIESVRQGSRLKTFDHMSRP